MKIIKNNLFTIILIALIVIGGLKILDQFKTNTRLHEELVGTTTKLEKLNENVANLERQYVTQKRLKKELEKNWSQEKAALEGRVKVLSNATYLIRETARRNKYQDVVYKGDKVKYVVTEIRFNEGPPVGYVLTFDNGIVVSKLYDHEIQVRQAISKNEETGKYNVLAKADYVLKSPSIAENGDWLNKKYPLKIKDGLALIDPTEPINTRKSFYFWEPQLNANLNASVDGMAAGLGVSIMGYGASRRDLNFKFLQAGIQYEKQDGIGATFTPVLWRPLSDTFSNTYIGPGASVDASGQGYFLGLQVGF